MQDCKFVGELCKVIISNTKILHAAFCKLIALQATIIFIMTLTVWSLKKQFVFCDAGTESLCIIAVSCSYRPLVTEVRFRSWMSPHEICGQIGTGTGFSPSAAVLPCQFHSASVPYIAFIMTEERGLEPS